MEGWKTVDSPLTCESWTISVLYEVEAHIMDGLRPAEKVCDGACDDLCCSQYTCTVLSELTEPL